MSTVTNPFPAPVVPPDSDPFRYGWRYIKRSDGNEAYDQVPLTLEDLLYPEEGDFVVTKDSHDEDRMYLKGVFKARLANNTTAVVISDCRVAWDVPGIRPLGPDVTVFFGVRRRIDWGTFDVAVEGVRPTLITEITSPDTRMNDLDIKVDLYYRAGVQYYVIVDGVERHGQRVITLIGYRRGENRFERMPLDERGWLWLEPLKLWLGVEGTRVVLYDENGRKQEDYTGLAQARQTAEEAARAAEEEARVNADKVRLAEEEARVNAEKVRAAEEARVAAEKRMAELEAELRRLRGEV
jgi:hypothetical protein